MKMDILLQENIVHICYHLDLSDIGMLSIVCKYLTFLGSMKFLVYDKPFFKIIGKDDCSQFFVEGIDIHIVNNISEYTDETIFEIKHTKENYLDYLKMYNLDIYHFIKRKEGILIRNSFDMFKKIDI